jgi:uncharacterized membrane protein SpoIIM required for sporulation
MRLIVPLDKHLCKGLIQMTESAFIAKNEAAWTALEDYNLRLAAMGTKRMDMNEARRFARLFRLTGCHLAYAKTHYPGSQCVLYLNRIVGIAHNHFYIRETGSLADTKRYLIHGFPSAVREAKWYVLSAALLFFLGLAFAAGYVSSDTSRLYHIFPQGIGEGGGLEAWDHSLMSAVIMTNNISVAVTAFGLGITAGVGTVYVLVYNGIIMGGLTGFLAASGGDMLEFTSLILPHGVLELAAIFMCGGCGLMLGKGLLIPGGYTRRHALVKQAGKAAALIPGIVLILVLAGLIEGFLTPLPVSPWLKLAFAGVTGVGLWVYMKRG